MSSPVVRVVITHQDGSVRMLEHAAAVKWWEWVLECVKSAVNHGVPLIELPWNIRRPVVAKSQNVNLDPVKAGEPA